MTLQAFFFLKLSLNVAGCAEDPHTCQINYNHSKIEITQTINLFV